VSPRRYNSQSGFTLIELLVASAIGVIVMTGLTSVVFTTYRADQIARSRVEASGEIRNFQATAYNDFAASSLPATPAGCGSSAQPCTRDPISLRACTPIISTSPSLQGRAVTYTWDSTAHLIARQVGVGGPPAPVYPAATDVTAFFWYIDDTSPGQKTVVVSLTVTVGALSQSQTMRFHPRVVSQLPDNVDAPC
jgi:prepilin-type N-terminal cleavage/methylation domain-containing protein